MEYLKSCEQCVLHFFHFLYKDDSQISNSIILWPNYVSSKKQIYKEAQNIKLYENVIWFSQVKALVNNIIYSHDRGIFENVFEFSKYPEMQNLVYLLIKRLMKMNFHDSYLIDHLDEDSIDSTLNAHFLIKMKNDNLLDKIKDLDKIFNDLSLRNEIKDESEIQWIHQIDKKYYTWLNIVLPRFKPQDLVYLFVIYEKGPLISNIGYRDFLKKIFEDIHFSEHDTFDECSNKIANLVYRIVFHRTNFFDPSNSYELKKQFEQELVFSKKYNTNNQENEALMKSAIFVLDISNILSSTKCWYYFFHDDTQFLTTNWIKDSDFIQKYPSLVYWLIKYQKNTEKLQNIYSNLSFNQNYLPFWLFTLRLMSSQNCIILDIDSSTTISTIITEAINKYITKLSKLGTDWLSLVLSSVPSDIIVPNYRIFYEFFCHLSEDNKVNPEMLNDYIIKYISEFTENVCQMVLVESIKDILEKPFERLSENDWTFKNAIDRSLAFIYDPNKYINQRIKELIHRKYHDFRELFRRIKSDSIRIEDDLNLEITELEKSIEAEKNAKKESFLLEQKRDAELNRLKNIDSSADDDHIPILIFGKTKTSDNFINELKSTINILSSFMKDIEEDIRNDRITKEAFQKPKEIRNKFEEISLLLTANFTDNTECPKITYQLNYIKHYR